MVRSLIVVLVLSSVLFAWPTKKKGNQNNSSSDSISVAGADAQSSSSSKSVSSSSSSSKSSAGAQSTSGVSNSGNSGSSSSNGLTQTYKEVRQTPFAFAPEAIPTAPCIKGFSAGGSSPLLAGNFGSGKIDAGCDSRETARIFALMGNQLAAAKILCSTDAAKRASLTLEDCKSFVVVPTEIKLAPVPTSELDKLTEQTVQQAKLALPTPIVQLQPPVNLRTDKPKVRVVPADKPRAKRKVVKPSCPASPKATVPAPPTVSQ